MNELGAAIFILGCSCHIIHPKLYKCKHCSESGHWEERCAVVKIAKQSREGINDATDKLIISRRGVSIQYHCKIYRLLECVITGIKTMEGCMEFTLTRRGREGELVEMTLKEELAKLVLYRYLHRIVITTFAVVTKETNEILNGLLDEGILDVNEMISRLFETKAMRDSQLMDASGYYSDEIIRPARIIRNLKKELRQQSLDAYLEKGNKINF